MKINKTYLKGLLEAFESAKGPLTNVLELKDLGFDCVSDDFAFHTDILLDKGLIQSLATDEKLLGAGYQLRGSEHIWIGTVPLRLTAAGHDFIDALNEPNVWEVIQSNFKESGLDTIKSVAIDLAKGYAKTKVQELLASASS